jgi:hypothetical protein
MTAVSQSHRVTLTVLGQTGAGKSEFLNGYLHKQAFKACADPNAVTLVTTSSENIVDGHLRTAIDTQGLDDTRGVDAAHVQQMVTFLKNWPHGINAFALVINGQDGRFNLGTQKLVKLIHGLFNDPTFWNHVCIVFTKCYGGCEEIDKGQKRDEYRRLVLKLIGECQGQGQGQGQSQSQSQGFENMPSLPVFFVDSKKYEIAGETRDEYALLDVFVRGLNALPTGNVIAPNVTYLRVEKETRQNILVKTQIVGDTRIQSYEDEERDKMIGYDGVTITYSEWKGIRKWENRQTRSTRTETTTKCVNESQRTIYRTEHCGGRRFGICGPRGTREVPCGVIVTRQMQDLSRQVSTDFDGHVSYGEWRIVRNWTA